MGCGSVTACRSLGRDVTRSEAHEHSRRDSSSVHGDITSEDDYNLSRGLKVRRRPSTIRHPPCVLKARDGKGFGELNFASLIGTGDVF